MSRALLNTALNAFRFSMASHLKAPCRKLLFLGPERFRCPSLAVSFPKAARLPSPYSSCLGPSSDPWAFASRIRRDLDQNGFGEGN